jgi:glycosyltransferase involved in cell wall biosynthesis
MPYEFSLVITTYNRFDSFLDGFLEKYLQNSYIHEIIISDDCSNDYSKLVSKYGNNDKIKLFTNSENLKALKNKCIACTKATKEWICLMDSDNYCDIDYFETLIKFWNINGLNTNMIYLPEKGIPTPRLTFTEYIGKIINKETINWDTIDECLINIGNYVFHKSIVNYIEPLIKQNLYPYTLDVKYMNYIWINNDIQLVVVPDMTYIHTVHNESYYAQYSQFLSGFDKQFNWKKFPPS